MFFSNKTYHTACFFKLKKRFSLRSVDAAWSKVFFCAGYGAGSVFSLQGCDVTRCTAKSHACATAVWTTFTKNGTITTISIWQVWSNHVTRWDAEVPNGSGVLLNKHIKCFLTLHNISCLKTAIHKEGGSKKKASVTLKLCQKMPFSKNYGIFLTFFLSGHGENRFQGLSYRVC